MINAMGVLGQIAAPLIHGAAGDMHNVESSQHNIHDAAPWYPHLKK